MEKKTIIWHTPDEKPIECKDIYFYTTDSPYLHDGCLIGGCFYDDPDSDYEIEFKPEEVKEWAYVKEVLSASKALDVAREMYLKKCEELGIWCCPSEDDAEALERNKRAFRKVGEVEFDKAISEIIGGK